MPGPCCCQLEDLVSAAHLLGQEAVADGKRAREVDVAVARLEEHADVVDVPDLAHDCAHAVVGVELLELAALDVAERLGIVVAPL
jgi:hypothetical protein